jgi:hypothetical protein
LGLNERIRIAEYNLKMPKSQRSLYQARDNQIAVNEAELQAFRSVAKGTGLLKL